MSQTQPRRSSQLKAIKENGSYHSTESQHEEPHSIDCSRPIQSNIVRYPNKRVSGIANDEEVLPEDSASQIYSKFNIASPDPSDSHLDVTNSDPHATPTGVSETDHARPRASAPPQEIFNLATIPRAPAFQSVGIELDYDTAMPTLSTVQKNRGITLYLFDNAESHPRIRLLAQEKNVVFIKTMSLNGIAYHDQYLTYNIDSFQYDLENIKLVLESGQYIRLLLSHSGFGVASGLCLHAPKTWIAFKHAFANFIAANSVKLPFRQRSFELKWKEWEMKAKVHHEQLTPEMDRVHDLMQHEIEKKKDEWKLRAHLAYKKQKHQITNARRRIDAKLRDQRRQLQRERAKEEYLQNKQLEMHRHNELLKMQKQIERQHAEKSKDLDLQMDVLNDRMRVHRQQIRKAIQLKDVAQNTEAVLTDYTKNISANPDGQHDVYHVSKLENLLPDMNSIEHSDEVHEHRTSAFWDKMKKIDGDMDELKQRLSTLKNL